MHVRKTIKVNTEKLFTFLIKYTNFEQQHLYSKVLLTFHKNKMKLRKNPITELLHKVFCQQKLFIFLSSKTKKSFNDSFCKFKSFEPQAFEQILKNIKKWYTK